MKKGLCTIDTREDFKRELHRQLYLVNMFYEARKKLRGQVHKTMILNYVAEFITLMLLIPDFRGEELLFYFIDGFYNWAKHKLQCQNVKDINETIAITESLLEIQREKDSSKPKSPKPNHGNDRGEKGMDQASRTREVMASHPRRGKMMVRRGSLTLVVSCAKVLIG